MTNLKAPPVYKVIVAQLVVTSFMAVLSLLLSGTVMAYSALLGGLISALPNSYFALQAFKFRGASNAEKVVKSFIRGELGKIGITLVLFALSFTLITNLNELVLILGFVTTHFVGVMVSGLISYSPTGNEPEAFKHRLLDKHTD
ncbi:MAG: ATP synthase subunit I [Gammaproteobacteria bacterium]|nr:ATP synthase subunit I [Gammaproteobacteria bacterium]MDP6732570.1 ATP synthase subunit I [Gammaproteobacteria bacterium]